MTILPNVIKYILFQRTGYLKNNFLAGFLTCLGHWPVFYRTTVWLKSVIFTGQIKTEFSQDMLSEFNRLKSFLPPTINSLLDIGCGLAGIDILISQHYQHQIEIFLIDKTKIDRNIHYHFKEKGSFYNSLSAAKELLTANGIK